MRVFDIEFQRDLVFITYISLRVCQTEPLQEGVLLKGLGVILG